MKRHTQNLRVEVQRYKLEKDEIMRGSSAVGKNQWTQEIDGQLGRVIGAQQIETKQDILAQAGDKFDMGSLFLQISLVLGAIGLIVNKNSLRFYFLTGLICLGLIGSAFCIFGYRIAAVASV
jgi:hypothetical protein